jgi:hypothetical protein
MDEILSLDLNENVDLDPEYLTLRNILQSFKVRGNPGSSLSSERLKQELTNTYITQQWKTYVKDLMEGIDEHIRQAGDWETCDTHYRYHVNEKVTPHSQLTRVNEKPDF